MSGQITSTFSRPDPCLLRPFLGRYFFAFFFLWPANLPQKALEELAVLVEVFDGIGVVGSWTLHELAKVVGLAR